MQITYPKNARLTTTLEKIIDSLFWTGLLKPIKIKMMKLIAKEIIRKVKRWLSIKFSTNNEPKIISNKYRINPVLVKKKIILKKYDHAFDSCFMHE